MTLTIAHISDERYPSQLGEALQVIKTVDALGGMGCQAHLVQPRLATHYFKSKEALKQSLCDLYHVEGRFELSDIHHIPASDLRFEKPFHTILSTAKALLKRYDVVITRDLLTLQAGALAGLPILFETHKALPIIAPTVWRWIRWLLGRPNVLGLIAHSDYAADAMRRTMNSRESVIPILNGYDPSDMVNLPDRETAREQIDIEDPRPLAVYTGEISPHKGCGTLLDLAQDVPEAHILLLGSNDDARSALRAEAAARGADNFTLLPHVPVGELAPYLAAADVLLIPPSAMPLMRHGDTVLPMKVFPYLAAGRPTLAPDLPDTAGVLVHNQNSWRVTPDNRAAAAAGLRQLLHDDGLRLRLGSGARQDAQQYTWKRRAEQILAFILERIEVV